MKPLATEMPPVTVPDRGTGSAIAWSLIAARARAIFYLGTSIYISAHRLYWFDEIFVVRIAKLPGIFSMWRSLANAGDTMPPGYHLVMRGWCHLFGYSEVATR